MKMRKFLALALCAGMATSMVACTSKSTGTSGGSNTNNGEKENVELTLWGAEEDQDLLKELVEGFKTEYADQANITVTISPESEATCKDTLLTDIEAGADVFAFADDQIQELVAGGALLPVIDTFAADVKSENVEGSVDAATVDDTLYAYPMTADNGYFLFYDKEFLSEDDVTSLDQILKVCEENGKKFSMTVNDGWYIYSFFQGAGLSLTLNDDNATNSCDWNSTTNDIKGVDVAQGILDITANKGYQLVTDAEFVTGVADGTIIAGVSGTWNSESTAKVWGDNYAATKLPTYTVAGNQVQMSSFSGYKLIGVNKTSKQAGWASRLAKYLTSEESQATRFAKRGLGPSNINAAASEEVQANPAIAALAAQAAFATPQRVGGKYWDPAATLGAILAGGNADGTDLQTLLDTAVEGITAAAE